MYVLFIACIVFCVNCISSAYAAEFDPVKAMEKNKEMAFKQWQRGDNFTFLQQTPLEKLFAPPVSYRDFETGDTLDDTNPFYKERRWAFGWGVDMILRFPPGQAFCSAYIVVPAENAWPTAVRGMLYMFCLFYVFLGVAIVSDAFMGAIEQITSEKEKVVMQEEDGVQKEKVVMYTMWNDTVANLTLLALGSSAPEILLSVLETVSNLDKVPGELGPGTIVGSAAFNLLCITGICMWAVEEIKKIKEYGVFVVTAISSVFAYVWMIVVLQWSSPDVIEVWEGVMTLLMFPMLVLIAFSLDRNCFCLNIGAGEEETTHPDEESADGKEQHVQDNRRSSMGRPKVIDAKFVDCSEEEVRNIISNAKNRDGSLSEDYIKGELDKLLPHKKLNVNHYRMNTIRGMLSTSSGVIRRIEQQKASSNKVAPTPLGMPTPYPTHTHPHPTERSRLSVPDSGLAEFVSPSYSVLEGEGTLELGIRRHHGSKGKLEIRYRTSDLTAQAGEHYVKAAGTIVFEDGESEDKHIKVGIIDNKERNADRHFTCRLEVANDTPGSAVGEVCITLVTIIDDDLPGVIRFKDAELETTETCGSAKLDVIRENGGTGSILVKYRTHDGVGKDSAQAGREYEACSGELVFNSGEIHKTIEIPITDRNLYDRCDHFFVYLTAAEGKVGGKLGHLTKCKVIITADSKIANIMKEVLDKAKENRFECSVSWGDQFRDAMNIGDDEDGNPPSTLQYVMHSLTFLWKVLFALIPPPQWKGGWPSFCISLLFIGLVTAMVSEVASLLGCVMGLKDSVTAITFVALGTSLPDTFASKQAAEQEDTVDAAVGNVTGSNSVNVFLGLGLPWTIGSIYYEAKGECFIVPSGTLSFSVMIFTICATLCILMLVIMRKVQGGEIGGPRRKPVAVFMGMLWVVYIVISALAAYDHLPKMPGTENRCPCACKNRGILPWADAPIHVQGSCRRC